MTYTYVCTHTGPHDSGTSIVKDGKLGHFIEERFVHTKHAAPPIHSLNHMKECCDEIDHLSFSNLFYQHTDFGQYQAFLTEILKIKIPQVKGSIHSDHHFLHAKAGYSHSGFDDAVILVIDGAGSTWSFGKENLSVFQVNGSDIIPIYKSIVGNGEDISADAPNFVDRKTNIGAGYVYTAVTEWLGYDGLESGKTMGLSAYGEDDVNIPEILSIEHHGNESCRLREDMFNNADPGQIYTKVGNVGKCGAKLKVNGKRENVAYRVQKDFEKYLIHTCNKALSMSKSKNLVLTGGCALNCVANYKLLKVLPNDINLFVDPTCDDSSVSIGGVYHACHQDYPSTSFKLKDLYKGRQLNYQYELLDDEDEYDATSKDIAKLISNENIVAMAQGRSEIGPRALGNRSILFDPRVKDGKNIVNRVKKREYFRPFAGTVLLEHAREWFDMDRLEESPFMSYAIDVLPDKRHLIPSIVHVDGTCRIQTVTREQNKHYYDLISEFYKLTGVPILFNTSFNLAGDTMVDTIQDGLKTLRDSELKYMYLPEIDTLIKVPNK